MAFNIDNFNLPNYDLPGPQFNYGPPREIELSKDEEKYVETVQDSLSRSGLTIDSLFKLFNEWQSSKTKSLKRFLLSLSFILSLTLVAGVNITDIDLFGVSVKDDMAVIFLISLCAILIFSTVYYEYMRRIDLKIHKAKIASVRDNLDDYLKMAQGIDEIVKKNKIESIRVLFDDFKGQFDHFNDDIQAYEALKFYQEKLQETQGRHSIIERIELFGIYFLDLLAMIAILSSF